MKPEAFSSGSERAAAQGCGSSVIPLLGSRVCMSLIHSAGLFRPGGDTLIYSTEV